MLNTKKINIKIHEIHELKVVLSIKKYLLQEILNLQLFMPCIVYCMMPIKAYNVIFFRLSIWSVPYESKASAFCKPKTR